MIIKSLLSTLETKLPIGRIAVVPFNTSISVKSIDPYIRLLKFFEKSRFFKGVLLIVNSPGGNAGASEILYNQIKSLSNKKPVYVYSILAASGGYMIACGAKKIYSPKTGIVGSIGVIMSHFILKKLMEKTGIKTEIYKKGKHKDLLLFHRETTEEEKRKLNNFLEDAYTVFMEIVSEERKIPIKKVKQIATGEVFSAQKAKSLGLIDGIKTLDDVMSELAKEVNLKPDQYLVIHPPKPLLTRFVSTFFDGLFESFYNQFASNLSDLSLL